MAMDFERLEPGTPEWALFFANHHARYHFAASHVPHGNGRRLLDVACGVGYGSRFLAEATGAQVVAVDRDPHALDIARAKFESSRITWQQDDAVTLASLNTQRFDGIVSLETLEHLEQGEAFVSRLAQLVAPASPLVISTPNRLASGHSGWTHHFREYSATEFVSLLTTSGFSRISLFGQSYTTVGQLRSAARAEINRLRSNPVVRLGLALDRLRGVVPPAPLPEQREDFEFLPVDDLEACDRLGPTGPFVLVAVAAAR